MDIVTAHDYYPSLGVVFSAGGEPAAAADGAGAGRHRWEGGRMVGEAEGQGVVVINYVDVGISQLEPAGNIR